MAEPAARRIGRPRGPRRDPRERREELLDACVRCIRTRGADVSMADLAAEAGVTRPILYDHFGDRAGVAAALVERFAERLHDTVAPILSGHADLGVALRDGIAAFVAFADGEPALWRFLQSAGPAAGVSVESQLGTVVADALVRAGAEPAVAPIWAAALLGATFAATEIWQASRPMPRERLVEEISAVLVGGLRGRGLAGAD